MNNRCSNCGFLNFANASVCKRCKASFDEIPSAETGHQSDPYPTAWQGGYELAAEWPQPAYQPSYFHTPVAALPARAKQGGANALLWMLLCGAIAVAAGIGFLWKFNKPTYDSYNWQEYQSEDKSFSVSMPTKPVETVQSRSTATGQLPMHVMTGRMSQDGFYGVAYADYPVASKSMSASTSLDAAAQGAVHHSGAELVSKKSITLDGYPGLELDMNIPEEKVPGGGQAACRIIWVAPRMYIVCVGGSNSSDIYSTRTKYFDSFKLRKS
jgi:hypothetical protein